jgi:polyisoprenoid-binding protein YceI
MKTIKNLLLLALIVITAATSCKKADANGSTKYTYKLAATNPSASLGRLLGNITWSSGTAYATQIKFEAKNTTGTKVEFKNNVAQSVNLFNTQASALGTVTLTSGTYKEIEFKAELINNGNTPALELGGSFTSNSITTPVVFTVSSPLEIKTESSNVVISSNTTYTALTSINLSLITTGITEAMLNAATKTNGKIIISASSNVNLYNIIINNLTSCDDTHFEHD